MSINKIFHTTGMHCKSCEIMLRDAIESIEGCRVTNVSSKTGNISVEYGDAQLEWDIRSAIRSGGYHLLDENDISITTPSFQFSSIFWLIFAGILLMFFLGTDISGLTPAYEKLGFGVAFLVGLVASISTCLAVTGGIIIGYTESIVDKTNGWKTQLRFHMGRLIAFVIWGFLLGMIGQSFSTSLYFNGFLSIFVGLVLAYLGIQLLWLAPNISRFGFTLPIFLSRNITKFKDQKYSPWVGALTFLLPCGFTQSMMVFALSSHDPLQWAIVMGGFALGTLPVLLALGLGIEYIKDHLKRLNPLIASLLLVFGIFTITNGWKIIEAIRTPSAIVSTTPTNISTPIQTPAVPLETEQVAWSHDGYGLSPRTLILQSGKNYQILVTPESAGFGCKYSVILPGGREQYIKKWEPFTIEVDGSQSKTIRLVCGSMGMSQWEIVIQ